MLIRHEAPRTKYNPLCNFQQHKLAKPLWFEHLSLLPLCLHLPLPGTFPSYPIFVLRGITPLIFLDIGNLSLATPVTLSSIITPIKYIIYITKKCKGKYLRDVLYLLSFRMHRLTKCIMVTTLPPAVARQVQPTSYMHFNDPDSKSRYSLNALLRRSSFSYVTHTFPSYPSVVLP